LVDFRSNEGENFTVIKSAKKQVADLRTALVHAMGNEHQTSTASPGDRLVSNFAKQRGIFRAASIT
jgi:hypothetical protein